MGLSQEDQMKAQEQRVIANGGDDDGSPFATNDGCCCKENGGSACCRVSNPPVSFNLEKKKGVKNQISMNIGGQGKGAPALDKVCTVPTWLATWESEDAYAALALIGAAISVAVAYNCYRQLG